MHFMSNADFVPFSSSLLGPLENLLYLFKSGRNLAARGFLNSIEEGKSGGMFSSKMVIGFSSVGVISELDQTVLTSSPKDNKQYVYLAGPLNIQEYLLSFFYQQLYFHA